MKLLQNCYFTCRYTEFRKMRPHELYRELRFRFTRCCCFQCISFAGVTESGGGHVSFVAFVDMDTGRSVAVEIRMCWSPRLQLRSFNPGDLSHHLHNYRDCWKKPQAYGNNLYLRISSGFLDLQSDSLKYLKGYQKRITVYFTTNCLKAIIVVNSQLLNIKVNSDKICLIK